MDPARSGRGGGGGGRGGGGGGGGGCDLPALVSSDSSCVGHVCPSIYSNSSILTIWQNNLHVVHVYSVQYLILSLIFFIYFLNISWIYHEYIMKK
jgi:hypothetical protein